MNKLMDTVTFCKRAGKLVLGFDLVKQATAEGRAALVMLAKDISPKTQKEVEFFCKQYQAVLKQVPITLDEFWYLIGKRTGIVAVCDTHFAEKLLTVIETETTENITGGQ